MKKSYPRFLEYELPPSEEASALFHIVSAPYEKTVSYGKGTANGPAAIISASQRLETFDCVSVPGACGIFTHKPLDCRGSDSAALGRISDKVGQIASRGAIPVVLGGEHTVTVASAEAIKKAHGDDFGVIQFDAHTDLRDSYQGSRFSHGCVMRRIFSDFGIPIFQIGIRSLSEEEAVFRINNRIGSMDAGSFAFSARPELVLPDDFPKKVFVTVDVDALDPSIMPATGTPEPGGLGWHQLMACLEAISLTRDVLGFDVVELAPIKGFHFPDFTAARLVYNFMGMIIRSRFVKNKQGGVE